LPEQRPDVEVVQPALLAQLAPQRLLVRLARLLAAAGRHPPPAVLVAVPKEQRAARIVDEQRTDAESLRQPGCAAGELAEPAQTLAPRNRRIRGGRRRQDEELRLAEPALLHTKLGAFAERAAVHLLADEADPPRLELGRDALEMT